MSQLNSGSDLVPSARQDGDTLVFEFRGEIDLHNSPELRTAVLDLVVKANPKRLVLNLAQVPYMDSSGIAVLVELLSRLRRAGGKVFLTNLQPRVQSILQIARLDTIFTVTADEAAALSK
jgi:anti-sigma B factor antagonist